MRRAPLLLLVGFVAAGCSVFSNQGYTTRTAYSVAIRGHEVYDAEKSLKLAKELNDDQTKVFAARHAIVGGGSGAEAHGPARGAATPPTGPIPRAAPGPPTLGSPGPSSPDGGPPVPYYYKLDKFWPESYITAVVGKTDSQSINLLARDMHNVFLQQYIRDLVTEPSIHSMVPVRREVTLTCVPPPEQAAIATAASVAARVEAKGATGGIDARLAESVIKLFEQTERTVFLQYALFRLCEMSVNSAGEFRNVFPLIVHELVRQAASLTLEASIEAERARRAAADAEAAGARARAAAAEVEAQRLACVKRQQDADRAVTADAAAGFCGAAPKAAAVTAVSAPAPPSPPARP